MTPDRPAALFLSDERIVWSSLSFSGAQTSRPACALLLGAYAPITVTIAGGAPLRTRAVLVGPNVARSIEADRAGFYSCSFDPAHPACRALRDQVLEGRDALDLSARFSGAVVTRVRETLERDTDCRHSAQTAAALLSHCLPQLDPAPIDARVARVAAWLRREVPPRVNIAPLAALVHLSPGRLTHLFTQTLGVPLRSYLRWVRMRRAIALLASDQSIAEVAATIGFADAAHFYRVLRDYYAVVPSLVQDRGRVRVQVCDG